MFNVIGEGLNYYEELRRHVKHSKYNFFRH